MTAIARHSRVRAWQRGNLMMGCGIDNVKRPFVRATILGTLVAGTVAFALSESGAAQDSPVAHNREAGFVVTQFAYALGPDAKETGGCPNGMSKNVVEIFKAGPDGAQRPGETDRDYSTRSESSGTKLSVLADGQNVCMHPELAAADPYYRTLDVDTVRLEGINLDGRISRGNFTSIGGTRGIDNQMFRLVGCTHAYQSTGQANDLSVGMYAGEWGILINLKGVDDLQNDDNVEVGIYGNADPMQLSAQREALPYATYAMDQDPSFRATTKGRIKNGVLITDPVDVVFHSILNSMHMVRPLRNAQIRATVSENGRLKGYIAGYTPIADLYNYQYGFREGRTARGELSPLRLGSANGAARTLGYTCSGAYQAMQRLADGHLDPKTGKFTSISTQYRFEAINAFIVDVKTDSTNKGLVESHPAGGS